MRNRRSHPARSGGLRASRQGPSGRARRTSGQPSAPTCPSTPTVRRDYWCIAGRGDPQEHARYLPKARLGPPCASWELQGLPGTAGVPGGAAGFVSVWGSRGVVDCVDPWPWLGLALCRMATSCRSMHSNKVHSHQTMGISTTNTPAALCGRPTPADRARNQSRPFAGSSRVSS